MWPFKKKQPEIQDLPSLTSEEGSWKVIQAEYDSAPILIRVNEAGKVWAGHPGLPIKLAFAIPLNSPNPAGLPDPDENLVLNDVEDALLATVQKFTPGFQALAITTGTVKEFVLYIPAGVDIAAIHQAAQEAVTTHEVQCIGQPDAKWETYLQFRNG